MKAVILVGGEGTRLRPLTYDLPKPMVPICGKPFTQYTLELIKSHGIDEVIFSLGYKWDSFTDYFGDGSSLGMKIHYVVEDSPLGTAGAIKNVEEYLDEGSFLVFNGDILSEMNLSEIIRFHKDNDSYCTIVLTPVDNPCIYGVVELDDTHRIRKFTEKPRPEEVKSNLINAGLYALEHSVLDRMERGKKYSIEREIFPALLNEGKRMFGYNYDGYWMDIGTPLKYLSANQDLLMGKMETRLDLNGGVYKGKDTHVGENVIFTGPVWLGDRVVIEPGAKITGPAVIDRGCTVGAEAEIDGALLWEGTRIGRKARLDNCLIGRDCRIGDEVSIGKLAVIGSQNIIENNHNIAPEEKF